MKPETIHSRAYELSERSEIKARIGTLFASKRSDVTVRREQKDPELNLRAAIQRVLAKSDGIADQQAVGTSSSQKLH